MTREEAIQVLNTYDVNFDEYRAEEIADAIDMAIDALKAEETIEIKPMEIKGDFHIDDIDENRRSIFEDIVYVTRCKDCRYCANYTDGHRECRLLKNLKTVPCTYVLVDGNDYCSHGERRNP